MAGVQACARPIFGLAARFSRPSAQVVPPEWPGVLGNHLPRPTKAMIGNVEHLFEIYGSVAQLVLEQLAVNQWVVGSNPSTPAKIERSLTSLKESRAGPTGSPASIVKKEYGNG